MLSLFDAMYVRHSVRRYLDKPIMQDTRTLLQQAVDQAALQSGLSIHLVLDEPKAFSGLMAHYGNFRNCKNYLAFVAEQGQEETIGYYGEKLVLTAQQLGLNSCWTALTYRKGKVPVMVPKGQKLQIVIALGYGETQGVPHKNKPLTALCQTESTMPDWFRAGMEAVLLAPTAINQQKFFFSQTGRQVSAKALSGPYAKVDLGIVKYHFELGAGTENFEWV